MSEINETSSSATGTGPLTLRMASPGGGDGGDGNAARATALEAELADARAQLRAQEQRFRSTVERSVDGIIVLDATGSVRFANSGAEALFGRGRDQLLGAEFGFPAVAGDITEIDVIRAGARPTVAEMRVVETTWEEEAALLVLIRDVTDRKEALARERELLHEQAARASAEAAARRGQLLARVSQVLGSTLDLDELLRGFAGAIAEELGDVCLIDIDDLYGPMRRLAGARRDYTHRFLLKGLEDRPIRLGITTPEARVFHTGRSELVPLVTETWLDAAAEADAEELNAIRMLQPCSLMMVTLHAGPLPWGVVTVISCESTRIFGPAELSLLEEVVQRAGMAIENARLFRLAQEGSRAKSDFLAIVSHELRTPLTAVLGYIGLMEEGIGGTLTKKQTKYLSSCRQSAEHLIRLIEQVITFARLEGDHDRVEPEEVEVDRLLMDVATLTRPMADRRGLALHMDYPGRRALLVTDEKKLSQILINLVTNAIKYTDEGEVRLEAEVREEEVVFRVRDTGPGIPNDKLEEIFEPFRQLDDPHTRKAGGAGIGLAVVKNLTHLLGGEVGVESTLGAGSIFSVRLPRVREDEEAAP